jgi:hypothetical protein
LILIPPAGALGLAALVGRLRSSAPRELPAAEEETHVQPPTAAVD